ncbi:MAG: hypothetical protein ACO1SX_06505 [Actinomycetota bacterium]
MELFVAAGEAAWESHVTGELRLNGGPDEQIINDLEVVLDNPTDGPPGGLESTFYMDSARFGRMIVSPGEALVFPFSLRMGWGVGFAIPVILRAVAQFGRLGYSQVVTTIHALPPPCFAQIAEIAAEEAHLSVDKWASIDSGDGARVTFEVGEAMREVFDGLCLRLYRGSGTVYGRMHIDGRDHNLRDRMRSAAGLGVATVELRLPIGDVDTARKFFHETLRPYVNAVRQLPIPAGGSGDASEQLPRPSHRPKGQV